VLLHHKTSWSMLAEVEPGNFLVNTGINLINPNNYILLVGRLVILIIVVPLDTMLWFLLMKVRRMTVESIFWDQHC